MSLSAEAARAVVDTVKRDPESKKRIHSYIDDVLPDSLAVSGSLRNWGYVAGNLATLGAWGDPLDKEFADRVCTGIADATAAALNAARKTSADLAFLERATTVSREKDYPVIGGVHHTATCLLLADKTRVVFDWHATLSVENPMVYPSVEAWKVDETGVSFENFKGFD